MTDDLNRQCVVKFFDAYYSGDIETATACCDEDFETITYAPVDLFPHLGVKQGKAWVGEAVRTQQKRYKNRKYELKMTAVDGDKVAAIQFLSLTQAQRRSHRASRDRGILHFPRRADPDAPLVFRFVRFRAAIARPRPDRFIRHQRSRRDGALS